MKNIRIVSLLFLLISGTAFAHPEPEGQSNPQPTVRVPSCLQYPDSKTYVPCTGVVPVDKTTGDALNWSDVLSGVSGGSGGGSTPTATIGQPVPTSGIFSVGSNGTVVTPILTDSSGKTLVVVSSLPSIPTGSNVIGNIGNTGFNITGTLPAFAATPTFNLGTLNGAATDSNLTSLKTALGSPFQAGGSIGNTSFGATQSGTWNVTNITGTVSLPTGAAADTTVSTMSGKLPASLGAKTGATSLSIVPNTDTAFPITAASLPLPALAATSTLQTTGNTSLSTIAGGVATTGSNVPAAGLLAVGQDQAGKGRSIATSTNGGLIPGQAAPTSTRTAIAASTITTVDIARSGRLGLSVQVEATLTANVFLCANGQSATCSATVYDAMIPSGATAGTVYTFIFAPTGVIYAFTTGTPTVNTTSWLAQ